MEQLRRFIREIHRRSLWQVLAIYVAASWIVFEAVQTLTEGVGLPEWFPAFALGLLLIGLPIVLATAIVQDGMSPRRRDDPTLMPAAETEFAGRPNETEGLRRLLTWRNAIAGGVLAFALWGLVATGWFILGEPGATEPAEKAKSIAVLPFVNMSPNEENEYFSDGITEDIIAQLSQIRELRVISRTSVMQYKDRKKPLQSIGQELGVATILEGSVRRSGDRVRVVAQLIDARNDEHLWAETYDRKLTDIFAIQSDVAREIANSLRASLSPADVERIEKAPTRNLEAYDHYLQGHYQLARRSEPGVQRAIAEYEKATKLDPNFTRAYARIALACAIALDWDWDYRGLGHEGLLQKGFEAANHALRSDSTLADGWVALGFLRVQSRPDSYAGAAEAFRRALTLNPQDVEAHHGYATILRRMGQIPEAIQAYHRALAIDPRRPISLLGLARAHYQTRRYTEALGWADSALAIDPGFAAGYAWRARMRLTAGDIKGAESDAQTGGRLGYRNCRAVLPIVRLRRGDTLTAQAEAESLLSQVSGATLESDTTLGPMAIDEGWAVIPLVMLGEHDRAVELLRTRRPTIAFWEGLRMPELDPIRSNPQFRVLVEDAPFPTDLREE